ncbi:HAD-IIA family hydrolase [Devosia sp. J2-20]|uniref:HAD-IIA family hydrolase n=1 Tax=Devosia sp. J2-20 TaxID=3026161 RepID=UPI00249CAEFC|nr:HAD-IIA family hydrolase [Devosia sp. J2-20]WDQ98832.1 HAD-IIA family hydrolase [Devosia sp. J2-20]
MTQPHNPTRLQSLDELEFSAVLSDLDGIVYRGDDAIAGAVARFRSWHDQGLPYCFITNNAEKSADDFASKIIGLGIPCTPHQVVSAAEVTLAYVSARYAPGTPVYVVGTPSFKNRVEEAGFVLTGTAAQVVLVALDRQFDYSMMKAALRNVLGGAELIGTNPDLIRPVDDGFEPGAGAIAHSIATAAGVSPKFIGKPSPDIIHLAMERLGVQAQSAIMLGDQLDTDILAAQRAGVRGVFVETGVPINPRSAVKTEYLLQQL